MALIQAEKMKVLKSLQQLFKKAGILTRTQESESDKQILLFAVFIQLRQIGFDLGLDELLDGLKVLEKDEFSQTNDQLKITIGQLWCYSEEQRHKLEMIWKRTAPILKKEDAQPEIEWTDEDLEAYLKNLEQSNDPRKKGDNRENPSKIDGEWSVLPIAVPFFPAPVDIPDELNSYWPVSRRQMIYHWRYLRHLVLDGPQNLLDIDATIHKVTQQGFFLSPVYQRSSRNHAHLLLLIDQDGSMMPFHRFTRDIAETAQSESDIRHVDVFYFHNTPDIDIIFNDPYLTQGVEMESIFEHCSEDTSVLILSDVGAARGHRSRARISATTEFLFDLQDKTKLVAILNPVPKSRWLGSTAEIVSQMVPMFPMTADGFSNAIDVIRGLTTNGEG